jgi:hypothetical protein
MIAAMLLLAACGGDKAGTEPPDPSGNGGAGGNSGSGGAGGSSVHPPGDWVPLITADWTLSPGQEGYICATKTITETLHIGAIRPLAPLGTHHTVVGIGAASGPDDPGSPCGPSFGQFYAAGIGTGELTLPAGVGLVAEAGQQLHLNLHIYNVQPQDLSGTSGVEVVLLDPSEVQHEASIAFYGPYTFQIPGTPDPYTYTDEVQIGSGQTLIAIFPHMHRLGSHFSAEIVRNNSTITLWDEAFQFESQEFAAIPPVIVEQGDVLRTTCTWVNTTAEPVYWGDSSDSEMCFTVLMSY